MFQKVSKTLLTVKFSVIISLVEVCIDKDLFVMSVDIWKAQISFLLIVKREIIKHRNIQVKLTADVIIGQRHLLKIFRVSKSVLSMFKQVYWF